MPVRSHRQQLLLGQRRFHSLMQQRKRGAPIHINVELQLSAVDELVKRTAPTTQRVHNQR
jgi:hypothetical protein